MNFKLNHFYTPPSYGDANILFDRTKALVEDYGNYQGEKFIKPRSVEGRIKDERP